MADEALPPGRDAAYWLDAPAAGVLHELAMAVAEAERCANTEALVEALVWHGQVSAAEGSPDALTILGRACAEAEALGEARLLCRAMLARARHDADCSHHARALAACREVAEVARAQALPDLVRQALFVSGSSLCHLGEHELALEAFEEARMLLRSSPGGLSVRDQQVAAGRYAAAQAQAWLMRGGLLLEASGPDAAVDALQRARRHGEQACQALLGASVRFSCTALFGLVRVLLEAGEVGEARSWVERIRAASPRPAESGSLALAQLVLSEAMIELRSPSATPTAVLARLRHAEAVRHPRVVGGDLRLALLRCQFEASEAAGLYGDALVRQREWSRTKALLRARLASEHGQWTAQTLAGLGAEADDFVSQELRAPLTAAWGALGGLRDEMPNVETCLRRAQHSVGRAIDIADQYLGVMRAEHLRREDLKALDLSALVDDACDQMAPPPGGAVRLERQVARPVRIRGDRILLMRALGNLLSNAFKHAPPGTAVRVGLEQHGDTARLSVQDGGSGMPLEMRARIFQRFATGAVRKGNGLGLAMVARAARVHEARIDVQSEPGKGTNIVLTLGIDVVPD